MDAVCTCIIRDKVLHHVVVSMTCWFALSSGMYSARAGITVCLGPCRPDIRQLQLVAAGQTYARGSARGSARPMQHVDSKGICTILWSLLVPRW